ncbi:MAG: magnesium chelatase [candidate division NC10 bacterium]|nr:magnesium chelatase [candidate division NC10 bacterium]
MAKTSQRPQTLGELRRSPHDDASLRTRSVRDEVRRNLLARLKAREPLFPGIIGYDDSVIPQLVNAILGRHHFILLGLRGQAKSRILRSLVALLDEEIPVVEGCEIHDNPYAPICRSCRERVAAEGEATPIAFLPRERRYVEKLATPDVTIADILGDVDPIRAARGGHDLASELTIHYGLLPRANRGIFAINELPDLAGKIQVGLFNVMEEGDVQIKGYPVRLPLDILLVFSANPEDYTARGKIITPLKDRIGAEIRTHYPRSVREGLAITEQEAWLERGNSLRIPAFVKEAVEQVAMVAREHRHVDKRSGVSQRLPITALETVASNAERRALLRGEGTAVARPRDLYAALPAITGKLELEYEGEVKGGEAVAAALIREAFGRTFSRHLSAADCQEIVAWFDAGGALLLAEDLGAVEELKRLKGVPKLLERAARLCREPNPGAPLLVAAAELILEGLYALNKIDRSEERGFTGVAKPVPEAPPAPTPPRRSRYVN